MYNEESYLRKISSTVKKRGKQLHYYSVKSWLHREGLNKDDYAVGCYFIEAESKRLQTLAVSDNIFLKKILQPSKTLKPIPTIKIKYIYSTYFYSNTPIFLLFCCLVIVSWCSAFFLKRKGWGGHQEMGGFVCGRDWEEIMEKL